MPNTDFFPDRPDAQPIIYAYREPNNYQLQGMLKVGYTARTIDERMHEHYPTLKPGEKPYEVVFVEPAMRSDGTTFMDYPVHDRLDDYGFKRLRDEDGKKTEWHRCTIDHVRAAYLAVRDRTENFELRTRDFSMRPEQDAAVRKTERYFINVEYDGGTRTPKFLWNAKMRFGKTFAAYELAKRMGFRRVLILTFKPAVLAAWEEDLLTHVDFEGWQFISRPKEPGKPDIGRQYAEADKDRPIVCFGSFQDFLGREGGRNGRIKAHHAWVREEDWDLVIFDEYHFGAWNENSQTLFVQEEEDERDTHEVDDTRLGRVNTGNEINEGDLPIFTKYYLFLSGTPFRALNSGEFIEEQIYNWTYSDEQSAKEAWPREHPGKDNPYEALPRMVMMTYQIPEEIRKVALGGEFNTFDLNAFFEAKGDGDAAEFVLKDYVQKWLDLIRGAYRPTTVDDLKLGGERPPMPYSHARLLKVLNHTLWYLPRVNACYAMRNLLREPQNAFFHDYTINVCAGAEAGIGMAALDKVRDTMEDPLHSQTITLTCGKLTTGVTVKPWCGIFMLTNMRSPETYFQAAFRVQSPWTVENDSGKTEVVKQECYVFDFALDRALRMVSDYSCRLKVDENVGPEQKVGEFINFLPVLAYDGSTMHQVSAAEILDMAMAGTSATLLARRWESALLVNVDNDTLRRILDNPEAMRAIMSIEGFRALGSDIIETIVNKSDAVKKAKREKENLTPKEKRELTAEEKEYKSKRKLVQEKLIKFATRIPVFMYLTDYREETLKDVITQLEPGLFKKVTGLTVQDFELLVSLGVFNDSRMNDAVYKFRRYEDSSLVYTGINRHAGERIGLFDTSLTEFEYMAMAQEESMVAPNGLAAHSVSVSPIRSGTAAKPASTKAATPKPGSPKNGTRRTSAGNATTSSHRIERTETRATRQADTPVRRDWIVDVLDDMGLKYLDKRGSNGCLWVYGANELSSRMKELSDRGATFKLSRNGGRATNGQSAWWLRDYPEERKEAPKAEPTVTQEQLDELEPGDTVFHKAFGYGRIIDIDDSYVEVTFDSDKKKKPSRKFMFPSAFFQGLLQIG